MRRTILVTLLIFVALAAIAGSIGYWIWNNYMYYSTDDAQVTGNIVNISAPAAGTLTALSIKQGDTVTAGQTIGTITLAPTSATTSGASTTVDLTSPINGTILQIPAVQNQAVAPGLTLVQVTDLSALTITAYVDENAINNVSVGQQVDITIDAYKDTTFSGHVKLIVQAAAGQFSLLPNQDPTSGNFTKVGQRIPVVITLDNNGGKDIVPGMSAEVTIHLH
ncbi:MAG TPA: efflux RND transporter periplasmic adaptor subunit [Ktedonobacteraceae bacterium]|jgi:multidrug resistance efflux pump|nr:efflux RND transporter periplasmic adaptor subunit [Ktedonobacteraceae bacterium]